jgi:hypothetical protein
MKSYEWRLNGYHLAGHLSSVDDGFVGSVSSFIKPVTWLLSMINARTAVGTVHSPSSGWAMSPLCHQSCAPLSKLNNIFTGFHRHKQKVLKTLALMHNVQQ